MIGIRPLIGFFLALTMALTSVSLAAAHAQAPMGEWVEVCSADGTGTVLVDARGNPVTPMHLCPDCVAALAALDLPAHSPGASRPVTRAERLAPAPLTRAEGRAAPPAAARGPPLTV